MNHRYPNESAEYRRARDELAVEEAELIRKVKSVARRRRELPLGGRLKEDYSFAWATESRLEEAVTLSELFRGKSSLIIYSFMFGPSWDNPCPSCTSIVDAFDRMANQIGHDAAFVVVGKAPAPKIFDWAKRRGWNQIDLVSGYGCDFQADYGCQEDDERQFPKLNVFRRIDGAIHHFWGSEIADNDIDMVWPYWNLMDLTPEGRPERGSPPQDFRSRYLEDNYSG
ncbi:MAG: DUF899 family protein [Pseudomonadaceae bacterium]|nr:DUF899 family protein [Pseudomonadaceae bacterium]